MRKISLALLLLLAACKGTGNRAAPETLLERGLFFEERDEHGTRHPISGLKVKPAEPGGAPPAVERVAQDATLDINGTLRIELRRDELGSSSGLASVGKLLERTRALRDALEAISEMRASNLATTRAWANLQALPEAAPEREAAYSAFAATRRANAERVIELLAPIRDLWPKTDPDRETKIEPLSEVLFDDEASEAAVAKATQDFRQLLEAKVESLAPGVNAELAATEKKVESETSRRKLRIEAFVLSSEDSAKKHAVHVEGYDDLDASEVKRIDPKGLVLTEGERKQLLDLMAASQEVAAALEKIRKGEATWEEAFAGAKSEFGKALAAKIAAFEQLSESLSAGQLESRVQATRDAFTTLLDEWKEKMGPAVEQRLAQSMTEVEQATRMLGTVVALVEQAKALRDSWQHPTREQLPGLVLDSLRISSDLAAFVRDLKTEGKAEELLRSFAAALEAAAAETFAAEWDGSGLKTSLEEWKKLGAEVRAAIDDLRAILGGPPPPPPDSLEVENPDAFTVPLDIAPPARISLKSTSRKAGDYLFVQATLLEGEKDKEQEVDKLRTTLRMEKLGWHADLVPAIVYVTGDQVAAADDSGGFSASLGWMWAYGPRDDEGDTFLSRSLGWNAGLHAAFLSFAPENDPEIGLGVSLGLWEGRLLFGAGVNLFAEQQDDGRFYYFIGSSLIPLLQAIQG